MTVLRINTAARNGAADFVADLLDAGSGAAKLRIYTGSMPATPATSPTGTLLVEITLNDPAFGSASTGVCTLDVDPTLSATAAATGTAGYARFVDSTEAAGTGLGVMDADVGTSGAVVIIDSTSIVSGTTVTVTSGTLTMPAA